MDGWMGMDGWMSMGVDSSSTTRFTCQLLYSAYPRSGGTGSGPALPSTLPFCVTPLPGSMEELHVKEEEERERERACENR
jgi:hypothetical protein